MNRSTPDQERLSREAVFRQMFETHFRRVARYVDGQIGDAAQAEDIASEVFRTAWLKLDADAPFGLAWLIRTAMHKTRDYQRREYRGAAAMAALARLAEEPAKTVGQLDRLALHDALAKLSERDLQIVTLTYWDGLSAGEVAQVLRMREGAVWTRLHRARKQLRVSLGEGEVLHER